MRNVFITPQTDECLEVKQMPKLAQRPKTATFNVRMLPEMKAEAERIYGFHGFTLHEAVKVFIKHSCYAGGFPFDLRGAPHTDFEAMEALREAIALENDPNAKTFDTVEELLADLRSDDDD
jgi:addiction module RelB/DinJ family antitoxin